MFNPKITPGPWDVDPHYKGQSYCDEIGPLGGSGTGMLTGETPGDIEATAAVPELLEVYKAAKAMLEKIATGHAQWNEFGMEATDLAKNIKNLEERHCEGN